MRGRKPVPPDTKVLRGTFRQDRDAPRVRARDGELSAPEYFRPRAVELFDQVVRMMKAAQTFSPAYEIAIGELALLRERAEVMRRSIGQGFVRREAKAEGQKGKRGTLTNRALSQLIATEREIAKLVEMLGLTPSSLLRAPKTTDGKNGEGEGNRFAEYAG